MKKLSLLLVIALCFSLCGCPAEEQAPAVREMLEVHIHAGKIEPGMTAKDVLVEVSVNHQPVSCRVQLIGFQWDGYWEMAEDEPVSENSLVRLDVYYSLPKGYDVEQINVTMECDGGNYDGTGSVGNDDAGNVEAWSRAFYGKEPLPPETEPIEQTQPTEAPHTHTWVEQPGPSIIDCSLDRTKTYKCSCGEAKTETIPAPGHDLKDWVVTPATCTKDGQKTTSCKRCNAGFTVDIPATGHIWSAWIKETGLVHKRTCSECGAEETANHNIPAGSVTCTDCGADIIN